MNRSVVFKTGIGLAFGLAAGWMLLGPFQGGPSPRVVLSDVIVEPWGRIHGGWWLKANLNEALVVQPDRPHWRGEVEKQHAGSDTLKRTRSYRLSTSSQRLRNKEVGPKPAGVTRIVAIGDSVTHGWGVAREEAYPAQLEAYLSEKGHSVEVINAGVPANRLENMQAWCERVAVDFDVDWVLWTRRPVPNSQNPSVHYKNTMEACGRATGAQVLAVLPPISTFDVRGSQHYEEEGRLLVETLGPEQPVLELTSLFREAQKGRGVALLQDGAKMRLVDQSTGKELLVVNPPRKPKGHRVVDHSPPMDRAVYDYFESHLEAREALFFDEGHPDAEGFILFSKAVGDTLISLWESPEADQSM
jgi:hypothetical protein